MVAVTTLPAQAWSGLELIEPMSQGCRNEVWRATRDGELVAVRRRRRSGSSLDWELDLMAFLTHHDFVVPTLVLTDQGERSHDGVVVQRWIEGRLPDTEPEWSSVATELARLHSMTERYPQRPGCCVVTELRERPTSVDLDTVGPDDRALIADVFDDLVGVPTAVVHGDPVRSNIRIVRRPSTR